MAELEPEIQQQLAATERNVSDVLASSGHDSGKLAKKIVIRPFEQRPSAPDCFGHVTAALVQEVRLRIHYYSRSTDKEKERDISPLRLVHYRNTWYLLAWCHHAQDLRTFALDAIRSARVLSKPAHLIDEAELNALFLEGFGIFLLRSTRTATLRFAPRVARWVKMQRWHHQQQFEHDDSGHLLLTLPYSDDTELIMEILRHGPEVEVLDPPELRNKVAATLEQAAQRYR